MTEIEILRHAIETFIFETGWTPTRFGKEAVRDPQFVFQLRNGREPRSQTRSKVFDFITRYERSSYGG